MGSCTSCGHQLGVGRFCTSCGASVDSSTPDGTPVSTPVTSGDWRTDTAERKLPRPLAADLRTPPAAVAPPPPPRYPLYADEVDGWSPDGPLTTRTEAEPAPYLSAAPEPEPLLPYHHDDAAHEEDRRSPVLWILATVLVLVLVAAGWWFLVRDDGSDAATGRGDTGSSGAAPAAEGAGRDVARRATASAPTTAPPQQDVDGDPVAYDAANMVDGVPETAWRAEGDATGTELTFTLPGPTELVQVGLVNGYAKRSTDDRGRSFDWYRGNRRVTAVVWVFDDGTEVRQRLREQPRLQLTDVGPVTTTTVVLRLVRVTAPGAGDAGRDFTAVSEVSLVSSG